MAHIQTRDIVAILNAYDTIQRAITTHNLGIKSQAQVQLEKMQDAAAKIIALGATEEMIDQLRAIGMAFNSFAELQMDFRIPIDIIVLLTKWRAHFDHTAAANARARNYRDRRRGKTPLPATAYKPLQFSPEINTVAQEVPIQPRDAPQLRPGESATGADPLTDSDIFFRDGKPYLKLPDGSEIEVLDWAEPE